MIETLDGFPHRIGQCVCGIRPGADHKGGPLECGLSHWDVHFRSGALGQVDVTDVSHDPDDGLPLRLGVVGVPAGGAATDGVAMRHQLTNKGLVHYHDGG